MQVRKWFWSYIGLVLATIVFVPTAIIFAVELVPFIVALILGISVFMNSGIELSARSELKKILWKKCLRIERIRGRPRFK